MRADIVVLALGLGIVMGRHACASQTGTPAKAAAVGNDNQFALDLYAHLGRHVDSDRERKSKNLFFSPASVTLALTMATAGARGPTQTEMATVLGLGEDLGQAHARHRGLLEKWNAVGEKRPYQLRVANRLWGQKDYPIRAAFLDLTRQQYGAEMQQVDFSSDVEAARRTINQWVANRTESKIRELILRGMLTPGTRLVLTNAVYFKGDWVHPFDKRFTRQENFHISAEQTVRVPLMRQEEAFGYYEDEMLQGLEMPYAGRDLSMIVLLPKKADGLPGLEKALSLERLDSLLAKLVSRKVIALMPRFKMEIAFRLNSPLLTMGMRRAFSFEEADFSGITSAGKLYISLVIHQAFVDVNEEGTEAAAATAVVFPGGAPRTNPTPVFRADHPFMFMIRDTRTGSILFMGRMVQP